MSNWASSGPKITNRIRFAVFSRIRLCWDVIFCRWERISRRVEGLSCIFVFRVCEHTVRTLSQRAQPVQAVWRNRKYSFFTSFLNFNNLIILYCYTHVRYNYRTAYYERNEFIFLYKLLNSYGIPYHELQLHYIAPYLRFFCYDGMLMVFSAETGCHFSKWNNVVLFCGNLTIYLIL